MIKSKQKLIKYRQNFYNVHVWKEIFLKVFSVPHVLLKEVSEEAYPSNSIDILLE